MLVTGSCMITHYRLPVIYLDWFAWLPSKSVKFTDCCDMSKKTQCESVKSDGQNVLVLACVFLQ